MGQNGDCEGLASRSKPAAVRDGDAKVFVGIDRNVVDTNFVVKVRAGRAAALADITNHVAAVYALASGDRKTGKMPVTGADAVAMLNHDGLAIATQRVGQSHDAVGRRNDRGTVAGADVHAAMERAFSVERINTFSEAASHLALYWPKVWSSIGTDPIGSRGVPRQTHGKTNHGRTGKRRGA